MGALILNSSKIGARLALSVMVFVWIIALYTVISGDMSITEQCAELAANPIDMAGELIENLPIISKIPFLQGIVNVYSAATTVDAQQTVFKDVYFTLLSTIIVYPSMWLFNFFKKFLGRTENTLSNIIIFTICDAICDFIIVYIGTVIAIIISNWILFSIFKGNYIVGFFVLLILQLIISAVKSFFGTKNSDTKGNLFLNVAGSIFVNILLEVAIFSCVLYGNAILFKGFFATECIFGFLVSLGAMGAAVFFKIKNNF